MLKPNCDTTLDLYRLSYSVGFGIHNVPLFSAPWPGVPTYLFLVGPSLLLVLTSPDTYMPSYNLKYTHQGENTATDVVGTAPVQSELYG